MAKKKRLRIAAVQSFSNVTHHGAELKGQWHVIFKNLNPITLELGCGKGDYTLSLAQRYPDKNFIGVDLKSARLWSAATRALDKQIENVYFIRANVLELADIFEQDDISEVWITFPDPYPKKPRKRMTSQRYLDVYSKICRPNASLHMKTDDENFYEFSLVSLADYGCTIRQKMSELHGQDVDEDLGIKTFYEKRHIEAGSGR